MSRPAVTGAGWLPDPVPGRGVHLALDGDEWEWRSYQDLVTGALTVAGELATAGVRRGDVVCVVLPTDLRCLEAFFGVWAVGATLCPVAPPRFTDRAEYARRLGAVLNQARPSVVVVSDDGAELVAESIDHADRRVPLLRLTGGAGPIEPRPLAEISLLQFTSGSTATPKGVRVTSSNLAANIDAIRHWLRWDDGEGVASWLPLYHDMGLIGCLLVPAVQQNDLWLMRPDQFVRDPLRWIRCFGDGRARHTAAPSFGYGYAAARMTDRHLDGLDFRNWKNAIVGAEFVDARALDSFLAAARPRGFPVEAFAPAYGLAEATLSVTGRQPGRAPRLARIDQRSLTFGAPVTVDRTGDLGDVPVEDAGWVVGCGVPTGDTEVVVRDQDGRPLPDGHLGEISVRGRSVADGYHASATSVSTRFADGAVHTGDAGMVVDGQLYVLGRMGDSIKIRGRTVYVEDLETRLVAETGLPSWRCAVIGSSGAAGGGVLVLVEAAPDSVTEQVCDVLDRELGGEQPLTVVAGRPGLIRRTTSGKPRRRTMWQMFSSGELDSSVVARRHQPQG